MTSSPTTAARSGAAAPLGVLLGVLLDPVGRVADRLDVLGIGAPERP